MKVKIVNSLSLLNRADVNFNLCEIKKMYNTWKIEDIKDIVVRDPSCYGFQYCNDGIPIIRIGDIKQPFIDYTHIVKISEHIHNKFNKTHLKKYDILMSVRGVSIGKVGIFMGEYRNANISPNIIIIRLKDVSLAPYVCMILISDVGQQQIKRIIAGSSKPTINASLINKIQIPVPDELLLNEINKLFNEASEKRRDAKLLLKDIKQIFDKKIYFTKENKKVCYIEKDLMKSHRWDPHYHNPKYKSLRKNLMNIEKCSILSEIIDPVIDTIEKDYSDKIGYIEISNINDITAQVEGFKYDYINKLPKGSKLILKDGDILVSKVRPYRNSITIFEDKYKKIVTASKNAFTVLRTIGSEYPYYIAAFLRTYLGLNQIVMQQSGTTYPTVSDDEVNSIKIPILAENDMKNVNDKFKLYMKTRDIEQRNCEDMILLIENNEWDI